MVKKDTASREKPSLQAVIIADIFDVKLAPVLEAERQCWSGVCIGNLPLIDYTLEWLSLTECTDVLFVVAQPHYAHLQSLTKQWEWRFDSFQTVQCQNCMSVGDALREVDSRALISGDFVLIRAGTFCSTNIKAQLEEHRGRRRKDKNNSLTLIYSRLDENDHSHLRKVVGLETKTQRLTIYHREDECTKLDIEKPVFHADTEIRRDLRDTGIAICAPQICAQFSDNFDFRNRDDMIREILANEEVYCQSMHIAVLPDNVFACQVFDYNSLICANSSVLQRWSHPVVPDCMSTVKEFSYSCNRGKVYLPFEKHCAATIDGEAKVIRDCIFGAKSEVKAGVCALRSSIGSHSVLENDCVVENSVVSNNCVIGKHTKVSRSVICDEVRIGDNCSIGPRCIVGNGVILHSGTTLEPGTVLVAKRPSSADEDEITAVPFQNHFRWKLKSKMEFWPARHNRKGTAAFSDASGGDTTLDDVDSSDDLDSAIPARSPLESGSSKRDSSRDDRALPTATAVDPLTADENERILRFFEETSDSLQQGACDDTSSKNLILEINASKFAYNIQMDDVAKYVMKAILAVGSKGCSEAATVFANVKKLFVKWNDLLHNYYEPKQSQLQALGALEESTVHQLDLFGPCIAKLLLCLYEECDVLSEEAILLWYENLQDDSIKVVAPKVKQLVDWLKQGSDSSEEESD